MQRRTLWYLVAAMFALLASSALAVVLTPTSGGSFTDADGAVWSLNSAGDVIKNGQAVPGGSGTSALTQTTWAQDSATGGWYYWNGLEWVGPTSAGPIAASPSPSPTRSPTRSPSRSPTPSPTRSRTPSPTRSPSPVQATTFADDFNSLSLYNWRNPSAGGTWRPASWYSPNDDGYAVNQGWMVNPFNPATPYTSLYTAANGVARLGIQNNVDCGSACENQPYLGSQLLTQSFAQLYGYFEARIATPQVAGTGFAFWLMSASTWPPEIDIVEIVTTSTSSPAIAAQTVWDVTTSSIAGQCYSYETFPNYNATQFHTYGVDWTSATVTFYIDRIARCSFPTPTGYTAPMFPILSSQQGGDWSGPIPSGATLGPMQVDYVKVWASKPF